MFSRNCEQYLETLRLSGRGVNRILSKGGGSEKNYIVFLPLQKNNDNIMNFITENFNCHFLGQNYIIICCSIV